MSELPLRIVMVCYANICRSPYAALRAADLVGDAAVVTSAGVQGFPAQPMDDEMAAQLRLRDINPDHFRSDKLTRADLEQADLILTMEARQRAFILDEWPSAAKRVLTLSQFADGLTLIDPTFSGRGAIAEVFRHRPACDPDGDIPDPYRRGPEAAAATAALIDNLLTQIMPRLVAQPASDGQPDGLADSGVRIADILLPKPDVDLEKWAVVACDQFTSQPDYWQRVETTVGTNPSTLRLVFPEAYLEEAHPHRRIAAINASMSGYLAAGLFVEYPTTLLLVRRTTGTGVVRWGLMVALDLEAYDWHADSRTLIRATEGTIEDRIPPRKAIRRDAPLELPHIMVLISDPARTVIEPLAAETGRLTPVYNTPLMEGGGSVAAWAVSAQDDLNRFAAAIGALHAAVDPANPLLFAMGDGNHSLATAKSIWNDVRKTLRHAEREDHPARFALVELENIFDDGLQFEPIHRVLFGIERGRFEAELAKHCGSFEFAAADLEATLAIVDRQEDAQRFGYADAEVSGVYSLSNPEASIPAGTLQRVIDTLVSEGVCTVDYIHGTDVTADLASQAGNLGLLLPPIAKETFFASIVADGALPRKTFSMGHAEDKRYYLEARRIR